MAAARSEAPGAGVHPLAVDRAWGPAGALLLEQVGQQLRAERFAHGPGVGRVSHPHAARSYPGDGTGVAWLTDGTSAAGQPCPVFAVDAEVAARAVPPRLLARAEPELSGELPLQFWIRWTRLEVVVKLLDVPMLTWIAQHGLAEPGPSLSGLGGRSLALRSARMGPLILAVGALDRPD